MSLLVAQQHSIATNSPTNLLKKIQTVKVLFSACFLFKPGEAGVLGAQDRAAAADRPSFVVADKLNIQKSCVRFQGNWRPVRTAVNGSQHRAALTDSQAFLVAAEIYMENCRGASGLLPGPGLPTINRHENRSLGTRDPATLVIGKINVNQLQTTRRGLALPCFARVVRVEQNAVDYALTLTN